jgi:hypothetical protein
VPGSLCHGLPFASDARLMPCPADHHWCAHSRKPMDMMVQGWSISLFQAAQQ